ncbi:hypothetical protein [Bartonella phoceensis]|uniref:hypothetical protein n=1 Tax=Bartonella phoceensis TaxID=270249 RepID=UPI001ABA4745|nr:hypothetical protein [Bartonella phoceensis]
MKIGLAFSGQGVCGLEYLPIIGILEYLSLNPSIIHCIVSSFWDLNVDLACFMI